MQGDGLARGDAGKEGPRARRAVRALAIEATSGPSRQTGRASRRSARATAPLRLRIDIGTRFTTVARSPVNAATARSGDSQELSRRCREPDPRDHSSDQRYRRSRQRNQNHVHSRRSRSIETDGSAKSGRHDERMHCHVDPRKPAPPRNRAGTNLQPDIVLRSQDCHSGMPQLVKQNRQRNNDELREHPARQIWLTFHQVVEGLEKRLHHPFGSDGR